LIRQDEQTAEGRCKRFRPSPFSDLLAPNNQVSKQIAPNNVVKHSSTPIGAVLRESNFTGTLKWDLFKREHTITFVHCVSAEQQKVCATRAVGGNATTRNARGCARHIAVNISGISMTTRKDPTHVKDLVPDPKNRRKHTPRNIGMIEDAMQAVGAARSIVIDENNVIHAGNGAVEAAANVGITKVRVVDADGDEIIAVRRRNLTQEQWRRLAMYDNRTQELSTWNPEQLKLDLADGFELKPWFSSDEIKSLMPKNNGGAGTANQQVPSVFQIIITCKDENEQIAMLDSLVKGGIECKALIS
jgi:hypothetical protein